MDQPSRPQIFAEAPRRHAPVLVTASRTIVLKPWALRAGLLGTVACVMGCIASTALFLVSDDVASAFREREARTVTAYERRISDLRQQLDMATSRGLVDRETLAGKVQGIIERQVEIERRYESFAPLVAEVMGDPVTTGSIPTPQARPVPAATPVSAFAPTAPKSDPFAGFQLRSDLPDRADEHANAALIDTMAAEVETIEAAQTLQITTLAEHAEQRSLDVAELLSEAGVDVAEFGQGGPFVSAEMDLPSDSELARLADALDQLRLARETVDTLPFGRPVENALRSSRFGVRLDPFLKRRALHTGLDYAARTGTPVKATGAGLVRFAGERGGYGLMVIVEHESGLSTRYAHLSATSVDEGDEVRTGDVVGKVGSTGRSTGPHLHYEVREKGKAVDPATFLQVGQKLQPLL